YYWHLRVISLLCVWSSAAFSILSLFSAHRLLHSFPTTTLFRSHHLSSLQPSRVLDSSSTSPTAPKREIPHCVFTVSDPMPYQPSSRRPSMAKRIAGRSVLGSSIATRKS